MTVMNSVQRIEFPLKRNRKEEFQSNDISRGRRRGLVHLHYSCSSSAFRPTLKSNYFSLAQIPNSLRATYWNSVFIFWSQMSFSVPQSPGGALSFTPWNIRNAHWVCPFNLVCPSNKQCIHSFYIFTSNWWCSSSFFPQTLTCPFGPSVVRRSPSSCVHLLYYYCYISYIVSVPPAL